jgi:hypothetical protein
MDTPVLHHCDGFSDRFGHAGLNADYVMKDAVEKMVMDEVDDDWVTLEETEWLDIKCL